MKRIVLAISLLAAICLSTEGNASASTYAYSNGAGAYGQGGSQPVNDGYSTTDSFKLPTLSTINNLNFVVWVLAGDTATSLQWSITANPFAGTLASGTAASLSNDYIDQSPGGIYNVEAEFFSIPNLTLDAGTYWLQLFGATTADGTAVYWDQGNGVSSAYLNNIDTPVPSEFFVVSGTTTIPPTPEPSTLILFGTGMIGLGAAAARKLRI